MEKHYKVYSSINSFLLITLLYVMFGCSNSRKTKCLTSECGVSALIRSPNLDSVNVGDSILYRSKEDKLEVFNVSYCGKPVSRYVNTGVKSNYTIEISTPMTKKQRQNYGVLLYQKNCLACHSPGSISEKKVNFLDTVLAIEKPQIVVIQEKEFFLVEENNPHWSYYCLDELQRRILKEYIDQQSSVVKKSAFK